MRSPSDRFVWAVGLCHSDHAAATVRRTACIVGSLTDHHARVLLPVRRRGGRVGVRVRVRTCGRSRRQSEAGESQDTAAVRRARSGEACMSCQVAGRGERRGRRLKLRSPLRSIAAVRSGICDSDEPKNRTAFRVRGLVC